MLNQSATLAGARVHCSLGFKKNAHKYCVYVKIFSLNHLFNLLDKPFSRKNILLSNQNISCHNAFG